MPEESHELAGGRGLLAMWQPGIIDAAAKGLCLVANLGVLGTDYPRHLLGLFLSRGSRGRASGTTSET